MNTRTVPTKAELKAVREAEKKAQKTAKAGSSKSRVPNIMVVR